MGKKLRLQTKLLTMGIGLTLLPLLTTTAMVVYQNRQMTAVAQQESSSLCYNDLDHIVESVYQLCRSQQLSNGEHVDLDAMVPDLVNQIRKTIMDIQVGQTGYVFVLDSKGNYVISKGGSRDGESLWQAKDANGTLFIQEMCRKAVEAGGTQIAEQLYPWKNADDPAPRVKIARLKYFEPWDWVIGASSYMDEFQASSARIESIGSRCLVQMALIAVICTVIALALWIILSKRLVGNIVSIARQLSEGSGQLADAAQQVASSSQSLAQGTTEQAAGLQETSSSLEEMASMTKQNADNALQASRLSAEVKMTAGQGADAMSKMTSAISDIQAGAGETAKIIKVIDEIAFQTNLLALNAAVEAARAGEAGKGFAVVAEEVRNLAIRSSEAAEQTTELIEKSVKNAGTGVEITRQVKQSLDRIVEGIHKSSDLVDAIAAACGEQAQGIDQINSAVSQMDRITQENAAGAEQSSSASSELTVLARSLKGLAGKLLTLAGENADGGNAATASPPSRAGMTDHLYHQIAAPRGLNCWQVKQCGRIPGGQNVDSLGVCPAYPDHGTDCWKVAGTFCGGRVQGSFAQKLHGCAQCDHFRTLHDENKQPAGSARTHSRSQASSRQRVPFPGDGDFGDFTS